MFLNGSAGTSQEVCPGAFRPSDGGKSVHDSNCNVFKKRVVRLWSWCFSTEKGLRDYEKPVSIDIRR